MNHAYIPRTLEPVLKRAAREFPAVTLTGPRQSGKTTTFKHLFEASHRYISMERPDVHAAAESDPRGFLEAFPPPVILDEIQYAPGLLPYIKEIIDERRAETGLFLLTGSQNLALLERITESLAGRSAMLRLLPMSEREIAGDESASFPWERKRISQTAQPVGLGMLWKNLLRGYYPELVVQPHRDQHLWHASYIQTYIERDVRSLRQIGDLSQFQAFIRALAVRSGQLLNLAEISRELGIAFNTAKHWLSVLEASFLVIILRPYFANIGKRLVKSPKVYFTDTGTLCYLTGLKDPDHAASGPLGGAIFETAVVTEIYKVLVHRGEMPQLHFWRTSAGVEVDLIIETGQRLIPIEIKQTATPRPQMASSIQTLAKGLPDKISNGFVIYPGDVRLPLVPDVEALPFAMV